MKEGRSFSVRNSVTKITRFDDPLMGAWAIRLREISPNVNPNMEERTASIILTIKEGEMMRTVRSTSMETRRPKDNVIRREIRVDEQDGHRYPGVEAELSAPQIT